ncbi:hypothetical protein E6W36_00930 [Hankyongella ginsenosidimutans]|uniref:Uncharacterized protein n=2 Tax=Hankyongella ginsenosidimutans TaxID=1763828 RepID=A0A4D7CB01_9SPHN|nr:hypothetical protein E6W36_00930 [Hankyongella ginsenosidimutans]
MASALLIWMMRDLQSGLTGFYFSNLDIRNVVEAITLVSLAAGLVGSMRHAPRVSQALALNQDAVARGLLLVFAAAIGGHLGNYFYSGVAKIMLDGGPLSWVLDNRLYDGIPGALEKGTLLTAAFPALTQAEYDLFKALSVPMNFVALIAQLLAVAAPLRRRWLIWITIAYDIFHLSVYLALGLLFWKWIALNTIILTTLLAVKDEQWDKAARLTCLACALVGTAFFHTATLAWYDTPGFTSVYFEAALKNGKRVRIPNAYFLSSSYQVSQGRLWWPGAWSISTIPSGGRCCITMMPLPAAPARHRSGLCRPSPCTARPLLLGNMFRRSTAKRSSGSMRAAGSTIIWCRTTMCRARLSQTHSIALISATSPPTSLSTTRSACLSIMAG